LQSTSFADEWPEHVCLEGLRSQAVTTGFSLQLIDGHRLVVSVGKALDHLAVSSGQILELTMLTLKSLVTIFERQVLVIGEVPPFYPHVS
jgi:hypothetical protein